MKDIKNINEMGEMNLSILREVCNIASGNALKSLVELTGLNLDIDVPAVEFADFRELPTRFFESDDNIVGAVSQDIIGDLNASILVGLDSDSMVLLLDNIQKTFGVYDESSVEINNLTDSQLSMLSEIGSILAGSYVSALSDFIKAESKLTAPSVAVDMSAAILSQVFSCIDSHDDRVLLIGTNLTIDKKVINTKIVLLPRAGALDYLLETVQSQYVNV